MAITVSLAEYNAVALASHTTSREFILEFKQQCHVRSLWLSTSPCLFLGASSSNQSRSVFRIADHVVPLSGPSPPQNATSAVGRDQKGGGRVISEH